MLLLNSNTFLGAMKIITVKIHDTHALSIKIVHLVAYTLAFIHFFPLVSTSLSFTSPSSQQSSSPKKSRTKSTGGRNLLILGNGNVAQAVIQQHAQIPEEQVGGSNEELSLCWNDYRFDSITCTYNKNPPVVNTSDGEISCVQYVPFDDLTNKDDIFDDVLLSQTHPITHILVTIPPQPKPKKEQDGTTATQTVLYEDVVLTSNNNNNNNNKSSNNSKFKKFLKQKLPQHAHDENNVNTTSSSSSSSKLQTVAFVSTTGVYGNHNGEWVNESSETKCKVGTKAQGYLAIEDQWKEYILNHTTSSTTATDDDDHIHTSSSIKRNFIIFRCSGLYGNNFSALHTLMKFETDRNAIFGSEEREETNNFITSRIHLDDVGRSILACFTHVDKCQSSERKENEYYVFPSSSTNDDDYIYDKEQRFMICNLSDDKPCPRTQVMTYAYKLLLEHANIDVLSKTNCTNENQNGSSRTKTSLPTNNRGGGIDNSERRRRRSQDQKQISNAKLNSILRSSLYETLKYPSYHEGLDSVFKNNVDEWMERQER